MPSLTLPAIGALLLFIGWRLARYPLLKRFYRWRRVQEVDVRTAEAWVRTQATPILDVREPQEFEPSHVAGARCIPLAQLEARADEIAAARDRRLLIICRGGVRSAKACLVLARLGFRQPVNVAGGMDDWQKQRLPCVGSAARA